MGVGPASEQQDPQAGPVRVVIVDDVADIRLVLRMQFELDGRFEVVGEGANGEEAIELASQLQPDLLVIDRNMPGMSGIEAIPGVRAAAPDTAVVLYSAHVNAEAYDAALAAGALDVLDKAGGPDFVEEFTAKLLDRVGSTSSDAEVRVGPVSSFAAQVWIENSKTIVGAVAERPDVVEVSGEALELFGVLLEEWQELAATTAEFLWVARVDVDELTQIVEEWASITALTDEQLEELGVHWSPPEGEAFFKALADGVLRALERREETQRLAHRLAAEWGPY